MTTVTTTQLQSIINWMKANKDEYYDRENDELNCTELAEAACEEFNGYDGDDIPEEYFEAAWQVYANAS